MGITSKLQIMKKLLILAAASALSFLSSCSLCDFVVVPEPEDILGASVLFRTGPDTNGNNLADGAELSPISPDSITFLGIRADGTAKYGDKDVTPVFNGR
jgi:hypothetical protein